MKYYFNKNDFHEEMVCKPISSWKEWMKDNKLTEMSLIRAKIEYGTEYFWCSHDQEVGLKGEYCGKQCENYEPRNGKSGRCKFSKNCYELTDEEITITI